MQLSAAMRPFLLLIVLLGVACKHPRPGNTPPVRPPRDTVRVAPPVAVRDTALEQRAARLELKVLEQEAQVDELQSRLDDARREVVRAMAKLQSLATRAEAASGMAEAEIALQALRTNGTSPERVAWRSSPAPRRSPAAAAFLASVARYSAPA